MFKCHMIYKENIIHVGNKSLLFCEVADTPFDIQGNEATAGKSKQKHLLDEINRKKSGCALPSHIVSPTPTDAPPHHGCLGFFFWVWNRFPSKHKTFVKHLYDVGPTWKTLGRRCTNAIQLFCVYWDTGRNLTHLLFGSYFLCARLVHITYNVIKTTCS